MSKKIVVIGMGYVGIPIAALFADVPGFEVVGVQRRSQRSGWKIDWLNEGKNPIGGNEPGLSELIKRVVKKGTFKVVEDISVCKDADAILIDVQTPTDAKRVPDHSSLEEVAENVGKHMRSQTLVVIESTVAPGTTNNVVKPLLEKNSHMKAGADFYLAFCYERVMVGRLIRNITQLPRIIGGINELSTSKARGLYKHVVKAELHETDALTAEVTKVVENAYRDVNIAFANEVGLICESLGVDAFKVRELVNTLPNEAGNSATNPARNMLFPGGGVGGHCLPKDSWLLKFGLDRYGKFKVTPKIIVQSREVNDFMPIHVVELLEDALKSCGRELRNAKVAVLGVAFLADCDDTRNTPSAVIYQELKERGAKPILHDPLVRDFDLPFTKDINEALDQADAVIISTRHSEYVNLDLNKLKMQMASPIMIDARNVFDKQRAEKAGFTYRGIGKGSP